MRRVYLYTHSRFSRGGRNLSRSLGVTMIKHNNSRFTGSSRKTVINWGSSTLPDSTYPCRIINLPTRVARAQNKVECFQALSEHQVSIPPWTTSRAQAEEWINEEKTVVARTLLRASAGRGIVLIRAPNDMVHAPLYTEYVKKQDEYRVHVINNEVVDFQKKAKRRDVPNEDINYQIRTHDNGFIYMRDNIRLPNMVREEALKAVAALQLDFGAVDVIWNNRHETAYVLEINTAPGLEGTTVTNYSNAFRRFLA